MAPMTRQMRVLARRYLAYRRRLGFALSADEHNLLRFARFADRTAPGEPVTTALALRWVDSNPATQPSYRSACLKTVRSFARFCVPLDPRTQLPPTYLVSGAYVRKAPHLYSREQIRLLMLRAQRLSTAQSPLRPATYETLIGLMACTGLRLGEALQLRLCDFDPEAGTLLIRRAKFSPERLLPIHPSVVKALVRYKRLRLRLRPFGEPFFPGRSLRPLTMSSADGTFRILADGLPSNGARPNLRWHDFRHSFATRLIARWSRQRLPVHHRLLLLSRYLGHRYFGYTWWYVSADPSMLASASKRFGRFCNAHGLLRRSSS